MDHLEITDTLARLGNDVELLGELYAAFSADAPRKLMKLGEAIENAEFAEARKIAHSLKGASATVGATRARELAERLEKTVETASRDDATTMHEALGTEVRAAMGAMMETLDKARK